MPSRAFPRVRVAARPFHTAVADRARASLRVPRGSRPSDAGAYGEELFRQLVSDLPDALWVCDARRPTLRYVNAAWETITGRAMTAGDSAERLYESVHPDDLQRVLRDAARFPEGGSDLEYRVVRLDLTVRWVHARTFRVGPMASAGGLAGTLRDITHRRQGDDRLRQLALYDVLTGLPNRTLWHASFVSAIATAAAHGAQLPVLFFDLDGFKDVNDTHGHATGDELLRQLSGRLLRSLRIRDAIGRIGGDEFVLYLRSSEASRGGEAVARKIRDTLLSGFEIDGHLVKVTASVGIALYPTDATDPDVLLRYADAAMYRAKEAGGDTYRLHAALAEAGTTFRREASRHRP
jgi:diguanylate cyclase (GGDEF)-like protein/PAS domain S-box-containing protein